MKNLGIYIHVPFCEGKCPYCDFYSVNSKPDLINKYTKALCDQLTSHGQNFSETVDTVYFGGGTPNLIGVDNINKIINSIQSNFILIDSEITIELNPCCYKTMDFHRLKAVGINRLSIGMQSANDDELAILGRKHNFSDVKRILFDAKSAGFKNISLDLMIATPSQTKSKLLNSLNFCVDNHIPHISVYLLKIEKGTKYFKIKNSLALPDEDKEADLYLFVDDFLRGNGYKHYEISNFCKSGMESRHNLKYWNCDEYLGLGPSAHSFFGGKRYFYRRSIHNFISNPHLIFDGNGASKEEYIMLRLRLSDGLLNSEYKKLFGEDIPKIYYQRASKFVNLGLVKIDKLGIKLTPRGFLLSNSLILNIIC